MSVADGEYRKTACPKGVSSHQSCSTSTLMISHFMTVRIASYTQTSMCHIPVLFIHRGRKNHWRSLDKLTQYNRSNSLRANPDKTQVTAFHLRNKEAKRSLKVGCNKTELENTTHTKYLGVTLDRTLGYNQHIHSTKMKVATRNNLLRKLSNSKWGANAGTLWQNTRHLSGRDHLTLIN